MSHPFPIWLSLPRTRQRFRESALSAAQRPLSTNFQVGVARNSMDPATWFAHRMWTQWCSVISGWRGNETSTSVRPVNWDGIGSFITFSSGSTTTSTKGASPLPWKRMASKRHPASVSTTPGWTGVVERPWTPDLSTRTALRPAAASTKARSAPPVVKSVSGTSRQGGASLSTTWRPAARKASACHVESGRLRMGVSTTGSPKGSMRRPVG